MDSKSQLKQRKQLMEFIDSYKELACLWDRQHPGYGVRSARQAAYTRLLRQYRAVDPSATLHTVKNRLDIIRCGFIRELKKVRLSKEMSSDPAMHYTPRLWYYDSCSFLEDQYMPARENTAAAASQSHYNTLELEETEYGDEYDDMKTEYLEDSSNDDEPQVKRRKDPAIKAESADESPTKLSEEDLECIGRGIALQMRDLEPYQSAIAHKLISETIFYAKIGKLTVDSHVALNVGEEKYADYS